MAMIPSQAGHLCDLTIRPISVEFFNCSWVWYCRIKKLHNSRVTIAI